MLISLASAGDFTPPHAVKGEVTSEEGQAIEDLEIKAEDETGSVVKTTNTDRNGKYELLVDLEEGDGFSVIIAGEHDTRSSDFTFENGTVDYFDVSNLDTESEEGNGEDSGNGGGGGGGAQTNGDEETDTETEENGEAEEEEETEEAEDQTDSKLRVDEEIEKVEEGEEIEVKMSTEPDNSEDTDTSTGSVTSVSFTSSSDSDNPEIEVTETTDNIVETSEEVETEPEGEIVSYTTVETNIDTEDAEFEFQLQENKLEERNAEPEQVIKQRYKEGEWRELETEHIRTENQTHSFKANSPEGFSIFATTIRTEKETEADSITDQINKYPLLILITTIILIAGAALIWRQKQ